MERDRDRLSEKDRQRYLLIESGLTIICCMRPWMIKITLMQRSDGTSDFWSNFFIWIYIGKSDFGIRINHWAHFKTHNPRNTKKVLIPKSLPTASYIRSEDSQVSPRRSFSATRFLYACWFDLGIPMAVIKTSRARAIRMRKCYVCQIYLTAVASSWGPSFLYCYHCRAFFVPLFYAEATVGDDGAPGSGDEAPGSGDEAPGSGDEAPGSGNEAPGSGDEADADDGFVLKSDDDDYVFLTCDDEFPGTGDEAEDDPLYYEYLVHCTQIPQFPDDGEEYFPHGGEEYEFPRVHYLVHSRDFPVEAFDPADDGAGHQDPDILFLNLFHDTNTRVWFY
ncbi:hypothetical protein L1049_007937 [Liquidambar formosana]|uniref:Uncharacterized protein n=1 Tax=Liquidambar formosana TaxID=63359 RepID=A0AAP0X7Y1_LIQFO